MNGAGKFQKGKSQLIEYESNMIKKKKSAMKVGYLRQGSFALSDN